MPEPERPRRLRRPLGRRQRLAAVFVPLVLVVGLVVVLLGVPWQAVVAILVLFAVWLAVDG